MSQRVPRRSRTRRRRWDNRYKLYRDTALQTVVKALLSAGLLPEQIAGRLALAHRRRVISHEAIYRFIYHRSAQKDYWHRLLPRHKARHGYRVGCRLNPVQLIRERVPIGARGMEVNTREHYGHWGADLMSFSRYGQAILMTHEQGTSVTDPA